jgi:predicted DsbA family dithiol-disulfide isomerase
MTPREPLAIDVVSDVVCPWCLIGKRHLERTLAERAARGESDPVVVRWHPFELNPDLPAEGIARQSYLERKFGGPVQAAAVYARVREAGRAAGIDFAFDAIARQPNTRDAHRLVAWAQAHGDAGALVEALFRAYLFEGRFIGDRATLATIAGEAGLDGGAAREWLESGEGADAVAAAQARVRALGISGVPYFIFGGRVGLSGAHPPETMHRAIAQAQQSGA